MVQNHSNTATSSEHDTEQIQKSKDVYEIDVKIIEKNIANPPKIYSSKWKALS